MASLRIGRTFFHVVVATAVILGVLFLVPAALAAPGTQSLTTGGLEAKSPASPKSQLTVDAYAVADAITQGSEYYLEVPQAEINSIGLFRAVQNKLTFIMQQNMNGNTNLYRVVVPAGNYSLDGLLQIYGNTILDCRSGVTIYASESSGNMLRAGAKTDAVDNPGFFDGGYDDYEHIYLLGGTWYGHPKGQNPATLAEGGYDGCNIRFGHASDVHIAGVTVKDNIGAHHVEVGGVDGLYVSDCYFSGSYGAGSLEALQLDVVHRDKDGFSGYWPFDDKPTINTTVEYCQFENLMRGVGSHHFVLEEPYTNITIQNNTFKDIRDWTIEAGYFKDSVITNNALSNVQAGIFAPGMVAGQTYMKNGVYEYTGPKIYTANLQITNNTISVSATGKAAKADQKYGIRAGGEEITSANSSYKDYETSQDYTSTEVTKTLPTGIYSINGVTITGNIITSTAATDNNAAYGIWASCLDSTDAQPSVIVGNNVDYIRQAGVYISNKSKVTDIKGNTIGKSGRIKGDGVFVRDTSTVTAIENNKIYNPLGNAGVSILQSTVDTVKGNTVSGYATNGVFIQQGSNVTTGVLNNTLSGASGAKYGVNVYGGTAKDINNNKISGTNNNGVCVHANDSLRATVSGVKSNTISGTSSHGISVSGSDATIISNNSITKPGKEGISVYDGSTVNTVSDNTVSTPAQNGINIAGANNVKVQNNTVTNAGASGVRVNAATGATVSGNKIKNSKSFGIVVQNASNNATISDNEVLESTNHGIYIAGSTKAKVTGNTSSSNINKKDAYEISFVNSKNGEVTNNKYGKRRLLNNSTQKPINVDSASEPTTNSGNTPLFGLAWERLSGSTALDTMEKITQEFGTASVAIVTTNALAASGVDAGYKDALAAAALAGRYNAPLLSTSKGGLADKTRSELTRMGVKTVYIVGSTNEVAPKVETQIKAMGIAVTRIGNAGASTRAIECAKLVKGRSDTVIIATQNNFKDALAVSPYAYATKSPILYAEANKKLSTATVNYIKSTGFKKAIIVGGPVALPASIETQLKNAGIPVGSITRLAGQNQYRTAEIIAEWTCGKLKNGTGGSGLYKYASIKFQPATRFSADRLGVARADVNDIGWKDALAGSALCGRVNSVLLLADKVNYVAAEEFVKANKTGITYGYVYGGTGAVPKGVMTKLEKASK